jgi:rhodanese-related sulfurtransferase
MSMEIIPEEYNKIREAGIPHLLLDVRQTWEVAKAKITPSINIPMDDLLNRVDELEKDQKIIVYCHHGVRSLNVCFFLRELGFKDVLSLTGGIELWSSKIDPTVPQY